MARYAKTAQVRENILEACLSAFGDIGFHGTSMAEIARRAGISHTGLLHHFSRKEDLLTAVLDVEDRRSATYLAQHSEWEFGSEALKILDEMIAILVRRERLPGLVELNVTLTGEAANKSHPAHEHFAKRYADTHAFLTRLFAAVKAEGRLSTELTPTQLATITVAIADGTSIQQLYGRDARDLERTVQAFLSSVVLGLSASESDS